MNRWTELLLVFLVLTITGCASLPQHYETLDDHTVLDLAETLKRIENEKLLFLGEGHTDSSDHLFQAEVIRHLHAQGRKVAVALEVFPRDWQQLLNAWSSGSIDEYTFRLESEKIWEDLFSYYGDILTYARTAGIRIFGISGAKGLINAVARQGTGIIPLQQWRSLRFSDCSEDPDYERLMRSVEVRNVHERLFPFFCDAQRLSDTIMAENLAELLRNEQPAVVVALIGAAHASKIAVPRLLSRSHTVSYKVLLPATFGDMLQGGVNKDFADYLWY